MMWLSLSGFDGGPNEMTLAEAKERFADQVRCVCLFNKNKP